MGQRVWKEASATINENINGEAVDAKALNMDEVMENRFMGYWNKYYCDKDNLNTVKRSDDMERLSTYAAALKKEQQLEIIKATSADKNKFYPQVMPMRDMIPHLEQHATELAELFDIAIDTEYDADDYVYADLRDLLIKTRKKLFKLDPNARVRLEDEVKKRIGSRTSVEHRSGIVKRKLYAGSERVLAKPAFMQKIDVLPPTVDDSGSSDGST